MLLVIKIHWFIFLKNKLSLPLRFNPRYLRSIPLPIPFHLAEYLNLSPLSPAGVPSELKAYLGTPSLSIQLNLIRASP